MQHATRIPGHGPQLSYQTLLFPLLFPFMRAFSCSAARRSCSSISLYIVRPDQRSIYRSAGFKELLKAESAEKPNGVRAVGPSSTDRQVPGKRNNRERGASGAGKHTSPPKDSKSNHPARSSQPGTSRPSSCRQGAGLFWACLCSGVVNKTDCMSAICLHAQGVYCVGTQGKTSSSHCGYRGTRAKGPRRKRWGWAVVGWERHKRRH